MLLRGTPRSSTVGSSHLGTAPRFVSRPIGSATLFNLERSGKFLQHDCSILNDRISPRIALLKGFGGRTARYAGPAGPEPHFFRGSELGGRTGMRAHRPQSSGIACCRGSELRGRPGMRAQRPQSRRDGLCRGPPGRPLPGAAGTASAGGRRDGLCQGPPRRRSSTLNERYRSSTLNVPSPRQDDADPPL